MKIWTRMVMVAVLIGALGGNEAARAEGGTTDETNYRCEAAKVRADSRELNCKGHCQRRSASRSPEAREEWRTTCDNACHQDCEERKARIEAGPLCIDTPPRPDPDRCASKLLSALAQLEFCISTCPSEEVAMFSNLAEDRVPRSASCLTRCNDNYDEAQQRIHALPVCSEGKTPVCVYQ